MVKNSKIDNDEINLFELMYTLWEGKWKIAAAAIIALIVVISFQSTKTKNFTAITEIKPVSTLEYTKEYTKFFNFYSLATNTNTNINLLNLYINVLNDRLIFEDAIRKFNLLDASQYNNELEYSEAIIRLASSVKILSPAISDNVKKGNLAISYHTINFAHHDAKKWISVLKYVDDFANKIVKKKSS